MSLARKRRGADTQHIAAQWFRDHGLDPLALCFIVIEGGNDAEEA